MNNSSYIRRSLVRPQDGQYLFSESLTYKSPIFNIPSLLLVNVGTMVSILVGVICFYIILYQCVGYSVDYMFEETFPYIRNAWLML